MGEPVLYRTPLEIDPDKLNKAYLDLTNQVPFHPVLNQISLNHRPGSLNPFYDGLGSLYDSKTKLPLALETDFTEFNTGLKDGFFFFFYRKVLEFVGGPLGRVRLMRLPPKSCMSLHYDLEVRLHIPIKTNSQAYMVFRDSGIFHVPLNGSIYAVDTTQWHTVMNGHSDDERIHLVFVVPGTTVIPNYMRGIVQEKI